MLIDLFFVNKKVTFPCKMFKKQRKESKTMTTIVSDTYKEKFREIGQELANVLKCFSLDLCGLISSYLVGGVAKKDESPSVLLSFDVPYHGWYFDMAIHPKDESLWLACSTGIVIFDQDGKNKKHILRHQDFQRIAISSTGIVFVTKFSNEINIISSEGLIFKKLQVKADVILSDDNGYIYVSNTDGIHKSDDQGNTLQSYCISTAIERFWLLGINIHNHLIIQSSIDGQCYLFDMNLNIKSKFSFDSSSDCYAMMADHVGNIYYITRLRNKILVLDPIGNPLTEFPADNPTAICFNKQGMIYVRNEREVHVLGFELP